MAAPVFSDYLQRHAANLYYKQVTLSPGNAKAAYIVDMNELTIWAAAIDDAVEIVVPQAHQDHLLFHSLYSMRVR